ncbi:ATP-binding protein [Hymenobacter caeli]|uniref:histidine kinase n=1 Tax=Hymenobacter caeli TaxID=2735894 RepID=A0ABX2FKF4_9BACT|nr:ATP-binding protein [Hymenobacter caeli]NRT17607.1 PAS domain S-box-containing protein [Hymenobacter caeli]
MNTPDSSAADFSNELRTRAEQRRQQGTQATENQTHDELQRAVLELQTYQAELETQYEALLLAQADADASRAQYVDLYEHAPVGYVTLDAHGTVAQLNRTASQLLGAPQAGLVGQPFAQVVAPLHRAGFDEFLAQVLATPGPQHREIELYGKGNALFHAQLEAQREELPHPGAAPRYRLAVLNTNDQHRAAAALAASEGRFRMLTENVLGVVFEWRYNHDGTNYCVYVSPRMHELFGVASAEVNRIDTFIHPADVRAWRASTMAVPAGIPWAFDGRLVVPDQPTRWCRGTAVVTSRDATGLNYSGLLLDVTAAKQLEASLRAATEAAEANVRAKQEFLANMSHEIRTPLHGILGLAELLAASPLASAQAEHVRLLQGSAGHLLAVLNDVLTTVRLGAGRLEPAAVAFDLGGLLRDCAALLQPEAAAQGLALKVKASPDLPWVVGDSHRLRQVLLNLLGNAVKFTEEGGRVELCVQLRPGAGPGRQRVAFSVVDTGIGIAPAVLDAVFEPFVQATDRIGSEYGGTGLGLSIARSLVEMLGGTLRAASEPGVGSTFHFALDFALAPADEATADAPEAPGRPVEMPAGRALLVEDNPVSSLLAETLLRKWGWAVDAAADGLTAVALFEAHRYDVVLMDLRLPGLDGTSATARLRQHPDPARAATPVLAVTAHAQLEAQDLRAAGFDAYLAKPFDEAGLRQALAAAWHDTQAAPAAPAAPVAPLYDLSAVRQMVGDNEAFLRHLVGVFRDTTPPILEALEQASARHDWPALADAAHHLKSSLYGVGVVRLYDAIRELETSEKKPPAPARAAECVAAVRAVTAEVMAGLAKEFA